MRSKLQGSSAKVAAGLLAMRRGSPGFRPRSWWRAEAGRAAPRMPCAGCVRLPGSGRAAGWRDGLARHRGLGQDPGLQARDGLVRRAVTRVLTPGTLVEDSMLSEGQNNFLAAVCIADGRAGLATLDPSTGESLVLFTNSENGPATYKQVAQWPICPSIFTISAPAIRSKFRPK